MIVKKIKLCFILGTLNQGGSERQMVELIKGINKNLFDVSFFIYSSNQVFFKEIYEINDLKIYTSSWKSKFKIFRFFELKKNIYTFLKTNEFDLVQTFLWHNGCYVRLFSPKSYKNKIISSVRTNFKNYSYYRILFEKFFLKNSFSVANSKLSTNQFKKFISKKYYNRLFTIYNGYDPVKFKKESINNNKIFTIGLVGRLSLEKNFIEVLSVINNIEFNIKIKIIGNNGNASKMIRKFILKNKLLDVVQILSPTKNINEFYNSVDLIIIPSIIEGCPNVLFESQLSDTLCLISSKSNNDDYVENGKNGYEYENSSDLINNLNFIIDNYKSPEILRIVKNARNSCVKNFSMSKMISSYEDLYTNLHEKKFKN